MTILERLRQDFGNYVSLEEIAPNIFRIYAPFFHEDGDMLSMYMEVRDNGSIIIRDFGNTLMRISYTFNLNSQNKINILNKIVKSNYGNLDDGELFIKTTLEQLPQTIFQFTQLVAKVSSIELVRREVVKSLFFERLNQQIIEKFSSYQIAQNFCPTKDRQLMVDYRISWKKEGNCRSIFLFGVNENAKASKVVISCLSFQKQKIPFRSLVIHEDFNNLSAFFRNQITNTADKQYASLEDFDADCDNYIERELTS